VCGRFYIDEETFELIKKEFDEDCDMEYQADDYYPTQKIPVIIFQDHCLKLVMKKWGYSLNNSHQKVINAKCETIFQKNLFKKDIYLHRCIVIAKGFYEWDHLKHKLAFENKKHKQIYMAGIYHQNEVVILTTSANQTMAPIHSRMPLLLRESDINGWLCHDQYAFELLKQHNEDLEIVSGHLQQSLF